MIKLYQLEPSEAISELRDYHFPPYITLAHMFHAPEGWRLERRVLKQYQFQYVMEGSAVYQIGRKRYTTRRGDLIFHRPDEPHSIETVDGEPYVCLSVVFHFGAGDFPMDTLIAAGLHELGNYRNHTLETKLCELVFQYRQPGLAQQLKCQGLLLDILTALGHIQQTRKAMTPQSRSNAAKLVQIRNFIDSRLQEGFTLQQLQEQSGWSRNYIISQFKEKFGMTPVNYLVWIRMEKAKELALQSGCTFSEIALRVGYADVHSFGRTFKRKAGMSLSQFCGSLFLGEPDR